jgi:chromate transporter
MRGTEGVVEPRTSGEPTPWKLFLMLASVTSVTLGGGYVIVPVMGRALEKRLWMTEERFYAVFARAQAFPGPYALSTALLVARELCGSRGALAAFFGVVLPPFLAIILVGKLMADFGSLPAVRGFLEGAGAVVPGIVAAMVWKTAKKRDWNVPRIFELAALGTLLILFPSASLPILLGGIPLLYLIESLWKRSGSS